MTHQMMKMDLINFIILSLATLRLTWLLVNEDGPFNIFGRLRHWSGIRVYTELEVVEIEDYLDTMGFSVNDVELPDKLHKNQFFAQILSCPYCCSVWVGLFIALLMPITLLNFLWYGLAFSAITILLREKF